MPVFSFAYIQRDNFRCSQEEVRVAQGKTVVHLHNSDLEKIDLSFPSHEEQVQISNCFNTLDNLITLHQRKFETIEDF
jgi:type I restriction enzyme S subunit